MSAECMDWYTNSGPWPPGVIPTDPGGLLPGNWDELDLPFTTACTKEGCVTKIDPNSVTLGGAHPVFGFDRFINGDEWLDATFVFKGDSLTLPRSPRCARCVADAKHRGPWEGGRQRHCLDPFPGQCFTSSPLPSRTR